MIVRVNDRGPYHSNRVMDVSRRVAETLDFKRYGTAKVKVEYVGHASLAGTDDAKLLATLNTGGPARWQGEPGEPTMVAEERPARRVAAIEPTPPQRDEEQDAQPMPAPPRRHVALAPPPPPERRAIARPAAVEEAYQRYGRIHEERPQVAERTGRRYAMAEIDREPQARSYHETPHLPIRDLLPPSRADRAEAPMPPSRHHAMGAPAAPVRPRHDSRRPTARSTRVAMSPRSTPRATETSRHSRAFHSRVRRGRRRASA